MKKFISLFVMLVTISIVFFSCKPEEQEPDTKFAMQFYGWEDSSAYFIHYTKGLYQVGYDTFYKEFKHEFEAPASKIDSLWFFCVDTLERYLEVIYFVNDKEVFRESVQANEGKIWSTYYLKK